MQGKSRTSWRQAHHLNPWGVSCSKQNLKLETQAEAAHQNRGRWTVWEVGRPDLPLDRFSWGLLTWLVCACDCVDHSVHRPQHLNHLPLFLSSFCSAISSSLSFFFSCLCPILNLFSFHTSGFPRLSSHPFSVSTIRT